MPSKRKRTTDKAKWSVEALGAAINLVKDGMSLRKAAKLHGIPVTTLYDRISNEKSEPPSLGRHSTFTTDQETDFAEHIIILSKVFHGLTPKDIRRAAFSFAEKNKIKHSFNKELKIAGKDWFYAFLKRNPKLSIRKPEATSINRIMGFNRQDVAKFYANLGDVFDKHKFNPTAIWNMDETGISTVQENGVVVAEKGQKRVGAVTSWERGNTITAVCCMSAAGQFVPPMFIFPRTRMTPLLEKDGPPGAIYSCSKSGWTNEDLFQEWLHHFVKNVKPTKESPVLLVMDNHSSHCSLEAFDTWREHGIVVVSLPPHTSHRLQPLDVTYYSALKATYNKECDIYLKGKNFDKITPFDVAGLFAKAYGTVSTVSKGISGFEKTGIYPFNPNIFTDEDFLVEDFCVHNQQPCSSSSPSINIQMSQETSESAASPGTSFQEILPIPKSSNQLDHQIKKRGRPKQHSAILSSTPMKAVLEDKQRKKEEKENKLKNKHEKLSKVRNNTKGNRETKQIKKYGKGVATGKGKLPMTVQPKVKKTLFKEFSSSSEDLDDIDLCDDDEFDDMETDKDKCFVCNDFGQDGELWYRCTSCAIWAHALCSGWDSPEGYKCDVCVKIKLLD